MIVYFVLLCTYIHAGEIDLGECDENERASQPIIAAQFASLKCSHEWLKKEIWTLLKLAVPIVSYCSVRKVFCIV